MRPYGSNNPLDNIPVPPDTVGVVVISTALAVVAQDWPDGASIVSFGTTNDQGFIFNSGSTEAAFPSTNSSGSTLSSGQNRNIKHGYTEQIPSSSTGYSITSPTSATITLSFWKK